MEILSFGLFINSLEVGIFYSAAGQEVVFIEQVYMADLTL
jgi:hypothetical protein